MDEILISHTLKAVISVLISTIIGVMVKKHSGRKIKKEVSRIDELASFLAWPMEKRHNAVIEEKFRIIFGIHTAYSQIVELLNFRNPTIAIKNFKNGKKYLEFHDDEKKYKLSNKIDTPGKQRRFKIINMLSYFFFSTTSLWFLSYSYKLIANGGIEALAIILIYSVFSLAFSISFILENSNLEDAKNLIKEQDF